MQTASANSHPTCCFSVQALAEPSVMARVLELFAKRGLMPSRWHSDVASDGESLTIDIQMDAMAPELADYIARCLRQLAYVEVVLTSVKFATPERLSA